LFKPGLALDFLVFTSGRRHVFCVAIDMSQKNKNFGLGLINGVENRIFYLVEHEPIKYDLVLGHTTPGKK